MTKILIPRSDSVSAKIIEPSDFESLLSSDIVPDYKYSGFTLSAGSGLAVNVSSGVCRLKGLYLESSAQESVSSLTASDVNYIYVKLARDSASEAESWDFFKNLTGTTPTDAFFIGTATTNGSAVTAVDQTNVIDIAIPRSEHMYYGDGRDGDVTISSNTSLSELKRYNNLTINAGQTLTSSATTHASLIIQVKGTLTINGTISMDAKGGRGVRGAPRGVRGDVETSITGNYNVAGPVNDPALNRSYGTKDTGIAGLNITRDADPAVTYSVGNGSGFGGPNVATNPGLTTAPANPRLNSQYYISTAMPYMYGAGGSGGTSGQGGDSGIKQTSYYGARGGHGGHGGDGGNGGGGILLMAQIIVFNSGAVITADGEDGVDGEDGENGDGPFGGISQTAGVAGGGGHGGGGGEGGQIVLLYNKLTNSGTFTVTEGAAGAAGAYGTSSVHGNASAGSAGGAGSAGATTLTQVTN